MGCSPPKILENLQKFRCAKFKKFSLLYTFIYNFIILLIYNFTIHMNKKIKKMSVYFTLSEPTLFVSWILGADVLNFFFSYSSSVGKNI